MDFECENVIAATKNGEFNIQIEFNNRAERRF